MVLDRGSSRCRSGREHLGFKYIRTKNGSNQGQNWALTGVLVPSSLKSVADHTQKLPRHAKFPSSTSIVFERRSLVYQLIVYMVSLVPRVNKTRMTALENKQSMHACVRGYVRERHLKQDMNT